MARIPMDPFSDNMDDIFDNMLSNMGVDWRYHINGQEVSPEEYAHYRKTGKLPNNIQSQAQQGQVGRSNTNKQKQVFYKS